MSKPTEISEGYETRDLSARAIVVFAIALVATCALIALFVVGQFRFLERKHPSPDSSSRIALAPHMLAPPPQLQSAPTADYEKFHAAEEAKMHSYAWIDKPAGVVRIPIERAMDLIAQRGLPPDASGVTTQQMQERKAANPK